MLNKKGKRLHYTELTTCEKGFAAKLAEVIEDRLNKLYKEHNTDWEIEDIKYSIAVKDDVIVKSALIIFAEI